VCATFPGDAAPVTACPLCSACQTLNRPRIEDEFLPLWLPEVSQAALIHLARSCHLVFHAHGEPPHMMRRPRSDTPALRAAYRTFHALLGLKPESLARIGTTSPRELDGAIAGLSAEHRSLASRQLRSIRLLPLGRLYQAGRDIYPDILDAWAAPATRAAASPANPHESRS
jgi:intracellular multiplication protein IcmJ